MELTRNRLFLAGGGATLAVAMGVYLLLYAPLAKKLQIQASECRTLEGEVVEARNLITVFKAKETKKTLIAEVEVSSSLEELTRQGNLKGINFVSVTPRTIEEEEGGEYRVLPIEMEVESTYESLGQFLGLLDDMEGRLVKVRDFNVTSKSGDLSKLITRLTINLYLREAGHAG